MPPSNNDPTPRTAPETPAYSIEPELLGVRPRSVVWAKQTLLWRRVLWNLLVGVGILLFVLARRDIATWDALIERGIQTQATVYDSFWTRSKRGNKYHLRYHFESDKGICDNNNSTTASTFATFDGKTLPVTYLPGSEKSVYQEGIVTRARRDERLRDWELAGLATMLIFGVTLTGYEYSLRCQRRLLRLGVAIVGRSVSGEITKYKNNTTYWLRYTFTPAHALAHSKRVAVPQSVYDAQTWGKSLHTVLYDEVNPHDSKPYFQLTAAQVLGR